MKQTRMMLRMVLLMSGIVVLSACNTLSPKVKSTPIPSTATSILPTTTFSPELKSTSTPPATIPTPFPSNSQLNSVRLLLSIENLRKNDSLSNRSDLLSNLQYDPAIDTIRGHFGMVTSIAFNPDGALLASASDDLSILLWDTTTWEPVGEPILGHQAGTPCEIDLEWYCPGEISSLAFNPDGSILASAGRDGSIRLWDPSTGKKIIEPITGHEDWVSQIAFSPDGTLLASASWDQTVRLWNPLTGEQLGDPLYGHEGWVNSVTFSPDGSLLASGDWENTIILWDPYSGEQLQTITALESLNPEEDWRWRDIIWEVVFSPEGKMLASVTCGGRNDGYCMASLIEFWDPVSGEKIDHIITGFLLDTQDIAFSPDGQLIISLNDLGPIRIWDPVSGEQLGDTMQVFSWEESFDFQTDLAFSPDGRMLATAGCGLEGGGNTSCAQGEIRLWDPVSEANLSQTFSRKLEIPPLFSSFIYGDDGEIYVALRGNISSTQTSIIFMDPNSSDQIFQTSISQEDFIGNGVFNQSGSLLASWDRDVIQLWDVTTGKQISEILSGHTKTIKNLVFNPDGSILASASYDDTIRLWDTSTGQQIGESLTGHSSSVSSVLFNPDGTLLASASDDNTIRLWNPLTGEQIGEPLEGSFTWTTNLAFSSDGKLLAAASDEIWLWDINTRQQIGEPLPVFLGPVTSLAFNPEGKLLASASCLEEDFGSSCVTSEIRLWDLESGQQIGNSFIEGIVYVHKLVFSPDGNQLISLGCGIGDDQMPCSVGEIRWWDLNIESWIDQACQYAMRNLTLSEWEENFPGESYHTTCPQWPEGE